MFWGLHYMNGVSIELENRDTLQQSVRSSEKTDLLYYAVKRIFDIIISITALIVLSPLLLVIAILIKLDSKGSVIFKQERIGKNGKPIYIYKFRSMIPNADEVLEQLMKTDKSIKEEYQINKKLENDPRVTRVGKFNRKFSMDELPQFINIMLGDMSFVGPRPYLYREKKDMDPYYYNIIKMTPGLTGLWQVSGRSNTTFKNRCRLDNKYYEIRSLKTDFIIILKTFEVVFYKKGAK